MTSYRLEGIIIKRTNLGEADKLLTLYTREKGKITLKVKGIRRPGSKRAGTLELFHQVRTMVVPGKGSFDVITEVELVKSSSSWRSFLGRILVAYQICETVDKLTPEFVVQPELYEYLLKCIEEIPHLGVDWQSRLDDWTLHIMEILGFWSQEDVRKLSIAQLLETVTEKPLNSHKLFTKLIK